MRRLALWILIALMPLRLWAADAMALSMDAPPAPVTAGAKAGDTAVQACAGHGAASHDAVAHERHGTAHAWGDAHRAGAVGVAVPDDAGDGHAHMLCDVCNGPAIAAPSVPLALGTPAHVTADGPAARFASAPLARGLKPPIA